MKGFSSLSKRGKVIIVAYFIILTLLAIYLFWFAPDFQSNLLETASTNLTVQQPEAANEQSNDTTLSAQNLTINFETDSSAISTSAFQELDDFVETSTKTTNAVIQIEGNTDSTGESNYNKDLSLRRAKAVATYLESKGIDSSQFVIIANGAGKPIKDNATEEGRAANRRTEVFYKKDK